jgi:hypothetical protein
MDIIDDLIIPGAVICLIATFVAVPIYYVNKSIHKDRQHSLQVIEESQQYVGMKMADFAEKFGPPRSVKDTEGIRFYDYYIDSVALLITTRDGVVTKVSKP